MPNLPINTPVYANIDEWALTNWCADLKNGYMQKVEDRLITSKRPGLKEWADLGEGIGQKIDDIYWWESAGYAVVLCNGKLFKLEEFGGVTQITGAVIEKGVVGTFVDYGATLFFAAKSKINSTTGITATELSDVDAPTNVTHLALIDTYLIATNNDNSFEWADADTPTEWQALSYAEAVAMEDDVIAVKSAWDEVYLIGSQTMEVWYLSGGTEVFARRPSSTVFRGCIAKYTPLFADNALWYLDNTRRFVRIEGRSPTIMSESFDREIQRLDVVSDARTFLCEWEGKNWIILNFPTESRTFVMDYITGLYLGEWTLWNEPLAQHEGYIGNCVCYAKGWNKYLIGSRKESKIYTIDADTYTDNGNIIKFEKKTGHISYQTLKDKRTYRYTYKIKRGFGGTTTPYMMEKHRDNGKQEWSTERLIDLGKEGDYESIKKLHRMGHYRTRQTHFSVTDNVPVIMIEAEEEIEAWRR